MTVVVQVKFTLMSKGDYGLLKIKEVCYQMAKGEFSHGMKFNWVIVSSGDD